MTKPTSLDEQLMEVMLYVRVRHEVEHNDNQWTREFVYSFDEAKAKINRLIVLAKKQAYKELGDELKRVDWQLEDTIDSNDTVHEQIDFEIERLNKELGDSNG